jgi:hypothetical protein
VNESFLASLTVLELSPPEMVDVAARPVQPRRPASGAGDAGGAHFPWWPMRIAPSDPGALRDTGSRVLDEILRLKPDTVVADFEKVLAVGAEFGATELLVAGNDVDEQRLTDNFALLVIWRPIWTASALEFMPWTDACAT